MLIDLSEILSTEGQVKDYDVISELKEFSFNGNVYVVDNVKNFHLTARNEGKRKAEKSKAAVRKSGKNDCRTGKRKQVSARRMRAGAAGNGGAAGGGKAEG